MVSDFVYAPTNVRRRYIVRSSLIDWWYTQNDPWMV